MKGEGGITLAILGGKSKGEPSKGDDEEISDDAESDDYAPDEEQIAAGNEFARAVKSGDGEAIVKAFRDLKEIC